MTALLALAACSGGNVGAGGPGTGSQVNSAPGGGSGSGASTTGGSSSSGNSGTGGSSSSGGSGSSGSGSGGGSSGGTSCPDPINSPAPLGLIRTDDTTAFTCTVDGNSVLYLRPAADPAGSVPMLLLLPYQGGTPTTMANLTQAGRLAQKYGVWVVLPSIPAGSSQWQDDNALNPPSMKSSDINYIDDVVADARGNFPVDPTQLYVAGYSNSGFFAERYVCQSGIPVAGLALIAATQRGTIESDCAPPTPLREVAFNGTSDLYVYYRGVETNNQYSLYSAPDTEKLWMTREGCDPSATTQQTLPQTAKDGTSVVLSENRSCASGAAVALYTINGGGHTWPGNPYGIDSLYLGPTTQNVDATIALWQFFTGQ